LRWYSRDLELDFENAMYFRLAEAAFVKPIAPQLVVRVVTSFERGDPIAKMSNLTTEMQNCFVLCGTSPGCQGPIPSALRLLDPLFERCLLTAEQKSLIFHVPVELPQHTFEAIPNVLWRQMSREKAPP
jgi:hypothetical protein